MNLAYKIARRYFWSKKKMQFINLIAYISMAVVVLGTASLIIALSVFNGLEEVVRTLHNTFQPDLQITTKMGKSFELKQEMLTKIKQIPGVAQVTEVIEDNAVLNYRQEQMVVLLKGVSTNFTHENRLKSAILDGNFDLEQAALNYALIGRGVQIQMGISLKNRLDPMQLWYPKRSKKINLSTSNPDKNFTKKNIFPTGVFSLEQHYDDKYVFVPIRFAEELLAYGNLRTSIEIKLNDIEKISLAQQKIKTILGAKFYVKTSEEQQALLLRAIKIEKFFIYLVLSFILGVSSFNIFFALMMLVIDKQKDIAVLQALGATPALIRRIFLWEGSLIAFSGASIGLVIGVTACLLQDRYGFVGMGTATTIVKSYPVKLHVFDFIYTFITLIIITILASYFPALKASKVQIKQQL